MATIKGQVVIITGASAGIGEATARRLAREGAAVVLAARRQDRLNALKREIESAAHSGVDPTPKARVLAVPTDVTSEDDRQRLVRATMDAFGRIDALVNNAGYGQRGPIELVSVEAIRRNFETNLFSLIALSQLVIPMMRAQRSGRIVNVGSVAGRIARPLSSVYDATKHALEAISDGMRGELAPFGVQVVLIEPGFILTEFVQVSDEIAKPLLQNPGPYAPFFIKLRQGFERVKRVAGRPEQMADLILRALTDKHPRARYAGPGHAHLALALKRLLPDRLMDYLLNRPVGLTPEQLNLDPDKSE